MRTDPTRELLLDRPDTVVWRALMAMAGCTLGLIGFLALLAWACGGQDYLQIDASLSPLHYNGAIGILLWGGAFLGLATGRLRLARVLAITLVLGGFVVMSAFVPGLGLRLDRWAFNPGPSANQFSTAGVVPGLAVGFVLIGIVVFLFSQRTYTTSYVIFGSLVGAILAVGAPVVLLTYATNVFVRPTGPSVLGGIAATVAGLALLTSAFRKGIPTFALGRTVPLSVGLLGLGLTFGLWMALNAEQSRRLQRQVQFEIAHVQRLILDRLSEQVTELSRLAERWDAQSPNGVKSDVGGYIGRQPGCLGVAGIDDQRRVAWIESSQNMPLPNTLSELGLDDALADALQTGSVAVVRPPRSAWRGMRVVVIFTPHRAGQNAGGLISVVRCQELFDTIVNTNVAAGYAVTVSAGDEPLFAHHATELEYHDRWHQTLPLNFRGNPWKLVVWPTQDVMFRENLSLPKLALLIGLLTSALLALAVQLAQTARRRTAELEKEVRERELAQQAMQQSEEKYRSLIENLGQGIFLLDREHRYVAANAQFCRSVGRTEAEIVGATETDLYDPQQAASHSEEVRTVLAEGKSVESEQEVEIGGRRTCIRRVLTPVRNSSGETTGVLGICWDVTEQRQLEAHVHQASKMDAIGQLAGGIAHDFNNLLTVILGNLELMRARSENDPDHELVASARGAAVRAAGLTQRLLGFSRRHQLDWRPTNLNALTTEVVALLERTIDPLIRIETNLANDLWSVQGDPTQLNQVLMNLCLNARDAIEGAGQITIETTCVRSEEIIGRLGLNVRGDFVRLRVSDTGAGMTPEVKARIYEPFFTTKEVGKGTGLGLAMVFAIVRQHKGWIDCWSEPERGTRFDIYLPRGEGTRTYAPLTIPTVTARTGQGTILVVDDEEMIRKLATLTLETQGYQVLQAADGQQAIDVYSAEKDRIDLIVLDLTMPVLSGHEAFRHLLKLNPRVQVLFASGYAVEQLTDLEKELMAGFVKKPYRPNDLLSAVAEALKGRPPVTEPTPVSSSSQYRLTQVVS